MSTTKIKDDQKSDKNEKLIQNSEQSGPSGVNLEPILTPLSTKDVDSSTVINPSGNEDLIVAPVLDEVSGILDKSGINDNVKKALIDVLTNIMSSNVGDKIQNTSEPVTVGPVKPVELPIKLNYDYLPPSINRISNVLSLNFSTIGSDVVIQPNGTVTNTSLSFNRAGISFGVNKSLEISNVLTCQTKLCYFVSVPQIRDQYSRLIDFKARLVSYDASAITYLENVDALQKVLLQNAGFHLNTPIVRLELCLSEPFVNGCSTFTSIGEFICNMPFASQGIFNTGIKADYTLTTGLSSTTIKVLEGMDLITGLILFGIEAVLQMYVIPRAASTVSLPNLNISTDWPVTIVSNQLLSTYFTHPVLSGCSAAVLGSARDALNIGVEEYGQMKIGTEDTLSKNRMSLSTAILAWNHVDVPTAKIMSNYYEYALQGKPDNENLLNAFKACEFLPAEYKIVDRQDDGMYFGKAIDYKIECANLLYGMAASTDFTEKIIGLYVEIVGKMQLVSENLVKSTHLGRYLGQLTNANEVYVQNLQSYARSATLSNVVDMISFGIMPELIYPSFHIPPPENTVTSIYTFIGIVLSIIFFPITTKYAIPFIHNWLFEFIKLLNEQSNITNLGMIRTRAGHAYSSNTERTVNRWITEGLRSRFFDKTILSSSLGRSTRIIISILLNASSPNDTVFDTKAQTAGFPRVLLRSDGTSTNGGKMRMWPKVNLNQGEAVMTSKLVYFKENFINLINNASATKGALSLTTTTKTAITSILNSLVKDGEYTAAALALIPSRLLENFPNLMTSVLYRYNSDYFSSLPAPLVIYDGSITSSYVIIGSGSYTTATFDIFTALALTQKFQVVGEIQHSEGRESSQPFSFVPPNPFEIFSQSAQLFSEVRPAGRILSITNYLYDCMLKRKGVIGDLLNEFKYNDVQVNASRYRNMYNLVAKILGLGSSWLNVDSQNQLPIGSSREIIVKLLDPRLGELRNGTPTPLAVDGGTVFPDIFKILDTKFCSDVEYLIRRFTDEGWILNRLQKGLYITKAKIDFDSNATYDVTGEEVEYSQDYFIESVSGNLRIPSFIYGGETFYDPAKFPEITFKINTRTSYNAITSSLLAEGYSHGRFSFYLPDIHYVWKYAQDLSEPETSNHLEDFITYRESQIFQVTFPDHELYKFVNESFVVRSNTRSIYPTTYVYTSTIGTGFNIKDQVNGAEPLKTEIMESGVRMGTYGTGIIVDDSNTPVPKDDDSISMSNLIPYLTSNARINDNVQMEYAVDALSWQSM